MSVVTRQQCAFVEFTTRSASEAAAEKVFNKLIIKGRRLTVKWGKSQGQQPPASKPNNTETEQTSLEPVPGLPAGKKCSIDFYIDICVKNIISILELISKF